MKINTRQGYAAHESFWADARMYFALVLRAFFFGMAVQIAVLGYCLTGINWNNIYVTGHPVKMPGAVLAKYHLEIAGVLSNDAVIEPELLSFVKPWAGDFYLKLPLQEYKKYVDYLTNGQYLKNEIEMKKWFILSFLSYVASVLYVVAFVGWAKTKKDEKFIRGAQMIPISKMNKKLAKAAEKSPCSNLVIGETVLPHEMESKHMLILGTSGSGKGVLMNQLIAQITRQTLWFCQIDLFNVHRYNFIHPCPCMPLVYPAQRADFRWNRRCVLDKAVSLHFRQPCQNTG